MVRGKGLKRSYTHGELLDLQSQKQEVDATIKTVENDTGLASRNRIDLGALKRQSEHLGKEIYTHTPKLPRGGVAKDALSKEVKEIRDRITNGMPSKAEMDHPADYPGAVHKHINWMKRTDTDVRRYKELQRRLEPDDPTASDIEKLRKKQ